MKGNNFLRYSNIAKLGERLKNGIDNTDEDSLRYISELIKLIPYIGSFIESKTFQKIKDSKLNDRLDELEKISENAVTYEDAESVLKIVEQNRLVLYEFIATYRQLIYRDNPDLLDKLNTFLLFPETRKKLLDPNKHFQFIIISGASATGKDVQLDKLTKLHFPEFNRVDILRKYTTRKRRLLDSEYYRFKTTNGFKNALNRNQIIFPYSKRENQYGFDKLQLSKDAETNTLLLTVFTEFSILKDAKQFLIEQGINAKFILFHAPYQELEDRTWHRNLKKEDIRIRLRSIKHDIDFIEKNSEQIDTIFDHQIYTGVRASVHEVHEKLVTIVREEIAAPNKVYVG